MPPIHVDNYEKRAELVVYSATQPLVIAGVANQGRGSVLSGLFFVGERRGQSAGLWTLKYAQDSSPRVLPVDDTGGSPRARLSPHRLGTLWPESPGLLWN